MGIVSNTSDFKMDGTRKEAAAGKARKLAIIIGAAVAVLIAAVIVITQVVMPAQKRAKFADLGVPATLSVGDTFTMGAYEQDGKTSNGKEEVVWRVLAVEDGKALLVSEKGLDCQEFNGIDSKGNDWDKSDLKTWLQGTFAEEAGLSSVGGELTLLSREEIYKYFEGDSDRMCAPTSYAVKQGAWQDSDNKVDGAGACYWWLRSAGSESHRAADVLADGSVYSLGIGVDHSHCVVRPALWVDL